jgi:putative SbcD/Mre11-related phosphoesterase
LLKLLQPYPALLYEKKKTKALVIADLHIGWEVSLAEEGIHVPSQTKKLTERTLQLIKKYKPTTLILLGDIKHTIAKAELEEWKDIPEFFETIAKHVPTINIILGNHDGNLEPLLPEKVETQASTGMVFGDIGLFHGHAWPSPELLKCHTLIMGHIHPTITFQDPLGFRITRQVWVKANCNNKQLAKSILQNLNINTEKNEDPICKFQKHFKTKIKTSHIIIMPSFNDFLGGYPINRESTLKKSKMAQLLGPILRSGVINLKEAEIYLLDGTFLGTISQLKNLA